MRYALYFTPPENDRLTMTASHWLGRDAFSGKPLPQPAIDGLAADELAALTAEPGRYGFHATLKAPFELSAGSREQDLVQAMETIAATTTAFALPELILGQLGPFFAFVPSGPNEKLQNLADECVRQPERFRAPLSQADLLRRNPDALPQALRDNLLKWGYPHVFDAFRFHMTLTGAVAMDRQAAIRRHLKTYFSEYVGKPLQISHLALFIEPERGAPFVVRKIIPLAEAHQGKTE